MKRVCLLLVILVTLSACDQAKNSANEDKTAVVAEDISTKDANHTKNSPSTKENSVRNSEVFLAVDENNLSVLDFETAYTMCAQALSEYYKATWNGADINLDKYMNNESLKQYTQKKITTQYELFLKNKLTYNLVTSVDIGARQVEFVGDDKSFFYLKLDARVQKDVGSFAEPTEFLIQSLNEKLVIVDWYTSGKDSYDSTVRGENQIIDNPEIWNNSEWIKKYLIEFHVKAKVNDQ